MLRLIDRLPRAAAFTFFVAGAIGIASAAGPASASPQPLLSTPTAAPLASFTQKARADHKKDLGVSHYKIASAADHGFVATAHSEDDAELSRVEAHLDGNKHRISYRHGKRALDIVSSVETKPDGIAILAGTMDGKPFEVRFKVATKQVVSSKGAEHGLTAAELKMFSHWQDVLADMVPGAGAHRWNTFACGVLVVGGVICAATGNGFGAAGAVVTFLGNCVEG